jgi:hypothetical protein
MSKTFFNSPNEQKRYDKFEALSQEEKETLKLMFLKQNLDYTKSIKNNVQFFFWFTLASIAIGIVISINA